MSSVSTQLSAWTERLPLEITKVNHRLAIASLISQIGIIVTGGAVRLTNSGLGCSNWPNCVPGSMTPTPEMGIHGLIEFGNRLLTFVLVVIAVAMIVSVWRMRRTHRTIYLLSLSLLSVIPVQAIIGGITVWTKLNPWVVSLHFLASTALVAVATLLVNRTALKLDGHREILAIPSSPTQRTLGWTIALAASAAVVLGTIVTGTGPHAGDALAPRHNFSADLVTRIHVVPVYILVAATIIALVLAYRIQTAQALKTALWWLVVVIGLQAAIGYIQHFNGLPVLLVLFHMLGSALLVSAATNVWDRATGRFPV
ncbi:cytochrome c oxidase assembly protein subunit 15 [Neomicrococcus aestuarii]|uniref:Cytochrome c oxidase assembly protein subunit 15 n=1 Tax=Neomicrococcus aestuarii TaxID=556325 RepID=A0A7W8TTN5_9MICC|nr:COX15/CtaA family protein [Neomicrococcus aestuarii]MBB5511828.1 cytochrome c oxidase assembly protein subunit 15 [Neomicrococcus aestuarii]